MALFTITTNSYINLPPNQVGDGSATTDYGVVHVFTVADFTVSTTPPYQDPEGDSAYQLKITSLPTIGVLKLSNVNVTTNQIINFTSISSGLFTYTPNNSNTSLYDDEFNFEISDTGSQQFVG